MSENILVQEVGWDSSKPGYDGLVDIAKRLLLQYRTGEETERATVRTAILCSGNQSSFRHSSNLGFRRYFHSQMEQKFW